MSVWRLVVREIKHRKLNFLLGLLSVAVAVGCLIGAQSLLRADRVVTGELLSEKQAEVEKSLEEKQQAVKKAGADLENFMRKQMLALGFNLLILPKDQPLSELNLDGTLSATMPERYVDELAKSSIVTVNHLLPSVTKRIHWDEKDRDIILVGTRGEVPFLHRGMKKPLLDEVAPGKVVVGYNVHSQLGLKEGDTITLKGREFTVSKLHPQRGSVDDDTLWINLGEAQEMLGMQNVINAILALECGCEGDRISQVRQDVAEVLPGTQVIERYSQAVTRSESRAKAKRVAEAALAQEKEAGEKLIAQEKTARKQIEDRHAGFAAVLVPLVIFGSLVMVGLLAFANARQRSGEIGILRAIGLTTGQVMSVFLSKAAIVGLLGGIVGVAAGIGAGIILGDSAAHGVKMPDLFAGGALPTMVIVAPLVALVMAIFASWIPALLAARRDPAVVLQGE